MYHPGKDRLYLTNITQNQVEVFNLGDSSFKAPVIVGSRPWGITVWPRDRTGTPGDTILVANSGGTDISYVDLDPPGPVARHPQWPLRVAQHHCGQRYHRDGWTERTSIPTARSARLQRPSTVPGPTCIAAGAACLAKSC